MLLPLAYVCDIHCWSSERIGVTVMRYTVFSTDIGSVGSLSIHFRGGNIHEYFIFSILSDLVDFRERWGISCIWKTQRNNKLSTARKVSILFSVPPRFVEVPQDIDVVEGQPASLRCRAHGYPPPNVQWIKDNIIQPTTSRQSLDALEGGSQLSFRYIRRIADRGQYDCVASSEAGTVVARAQLRVVARG